MTLCERVRWRVARWLDGPGGLAECVETMRAAERRAAVDELARQSQEWGLYDRHADWEDDA